MEQCLAVVLIILSFISTGVTSLQCYQCLINPPTGQNYNTTRLCIHFDHTDKYIIECPFSTMCMKQEINLDIQNGVRIKSVLRDCAPQKNQYQDYKNGRWFPRVEIEEPYEEGCKDIDAKGQRTTSTRHCYCRSNLCNSTPSASHEGYTDIMGVILVFNLMKYINSLR